MKPMLALPLGPKYSTFPCWLQPKFNGVRCLAQTSPTGVTLQTREEKLWSAGMLTHIREELQSLHPILGDTVLDGELYHHNWKLGRISGACAVSRATPNEDTQYLQYIVFDMVHPNVPFSHRYPPVAEIILQARLRYVVPSPIRKVWFREEVEKEFQKWTADGFEGVMLRPDVGYAVGKRSTALYKYKSWDDTECRCVDVVEGTGKYVGMLGALVLETPDGQRFEVGTGFDDEDREYLWRVPPIGSLVRFKYTDTTERGVYHTPVFLGVLA